VLATVRAVSLSNYVEVARFVGLEPYAMLRRARIAPDTLKDPEIRLPARAVVDLYVASAEESGCAGFGLLMAECRTFASLGPISLLLEHQPTVRAMIEAMIRFVRHFSDILVMRLEDDGETATIHCTAPDPFANPQSVENTVALCFRTLNEVIRGHWHPDAVHFTHAAPDDLFDHQRVLPCPIEFSAGFDGLTCPSAWLDVSNPRADVMMSRHAERLLGLVPTGYLESTIAQRARHAIQLLIADGQASVDHVADSLGVHPRWLQRTLEKEGWGFASLLNDVRRERVGRHLASKRHSIASVAQLAGYASQSAFTRWFGHEFGQSPTAWRQGAGRGLRQSGRERRMTGSPPPPRDTANGTDPVPMLRAASLTNYLEVGRRLGLDAPAMLRRAGFDFDVFDDPDRRIPARETVRLFADSAEESGCANFALEMAECRTLGSFGVASLLLRHQPTIRAMMEASVRVQRHFSDVVDLSLEDDGETGMLRWHVLPEFADPQWVDYSVAIGVRAFSELTRGVWVAECIHFVHHSPADVRAHLGFFRCPVEFDADFNGLSCPSAMLDTPNLLANPALVVHAERLLGLVTMDPPEGSATERVRHAIYLLVPGGTPSVERVGEMLDLHPRTLQRQLEQERRTFGALLNETRRDLAQRYLVGPHHSLATISKLAGFSSQSAFTRWFAAEFGRAPGAWRECARAASATL